MDGSGSGIEWYECSVLWQRQDKRALIAWVVREDGSGVGVIIYTTPVQTLKKGPGPVDVANAYDFSYQYNVSGFGTGTADTLSQAMAQAVLFARASDPAQSESRFNTKESWMNALTVVGAYKL